MANAAMAMQASEEFGVADIQLPARPVLIPELKRLLDDPDFDISSLAKLVRQDAGLTASLFRLMRSPAYANRRKLETVEQVLMVVGVDQTINLLRGLAMQQALAQQARRLEYYWERNAAIAEFAMLIAEERVTVCNIFPDQAYLAAMFMECGIAIMYQHYADYDQYLGMDGLHDWTLLSKENTRYNTDHTVAGHLLARHWGLPDFICEAIRDHHELDKIDQCSATRTMIALLKLAEEGEARSRNLPNQEWLRVQDLALNELGIAADEVDEYLADVIERYQSTHRG